jgi:ribosomal protein S18 acetylase RimI-like enzyme
MLMPSYEQNLSPVLRSGGIRLRTHVPEDFETLYQIDRLCYEPEIAYSRRELRDYLQLPGAECVVAEAIESGLHRSYKTHSQAKDYKRTAQIAGFCITAHQDAWGYIITIDVLERYRRRGVGTALLTEQERRLTARGVREVELETATDNESAIAFWQKHGYRTRDVVKEYYPGGRDAYRMTKIILGDENGRGHC